MRWSRACSKSPASDDPALVVVESDFLPLAIRDGKVTQSIDFYSSNTYKH